MEILGVWDYVVIIANNEKVKSDAGENRDILRLCDFKMVEELYKKRADVRVLRWSEAITKSTDDAHFLKVETELNAAIKSKQFGGFEEVAHIDYNKHQFIYNNSDDDADAVIYDFLEIEEFLNIQQKTRDDIKKCFKKSAERLETATVEDIRNSRYYNFLTEHQKQKSLEEQKKIFLKRLQKRRDKEIFELSKKLEEVAAAPAFLGAVVSVEWKRSTTWGKNPRATSKITTTNGTTVLNGSAVTGCGFDKLSESIARVLNASDAIKKVLYQKFEEALQNDPAASLREALGYGSGYELPKFEGGCGVSTICEILKKCGFEFKEIASGSNFNVFEVRK